MSSKSHHNPTCLDAGRLAAFVDGECTQAEAEAVRDHLRGCPSCLAEVRALAALNLSLSELSHEAAPEGLRDRVVDALAASAARPASTAGPAASAVRSISRRMMIAGGLALTAAAVTAGVIEPSIRPSVIAASVQDFITYRDKGWTVDLASHDSAALVSWAQQRVAFAVPEPKSSLRGFEIGGIRLCWLLNRRLIGLTYARGNDRAVLYIMESHGLSVPPPDRTFEYGQRVAVQHVKGHGVAVWSERDLVFVLVAAEPAFDRLVLAPT